MKNTMRFAAFVLSLTLSSCGGGGHSATDTGSASFGLTFEESAASAMKLAPSMAPAADICSSYGIDSISGTVYNSSNTAIATGGPWACVAHQGTINNIPPGSNLRIAIKGTVSGTVVWQGETTGKTIYSGQDTNVGSIPMAYTGSDTTRPTVTAATPTGTTVPLTSPITVTFSEAMAASTIDTTTFTLKNGSVAVPGSVAYNATTKTATFTPTSSLSNSVIYTATVTTDVTDMAANRMQSLYTWDFTTEAPPGSAPTTPTGVSATAADKQVTVSWTAVTGATSYNIYWSTTTGVTKTNGTLITGATSPYIHTALTNGTIYYYVVTAVNSYGESAASSQASAMPLPPITSAPTGVSAAAGNGQITISWSAVSGATSYNLYWSTTIGVTTANGTKITGATSPYLHTGLTNGTTYYYIVTAVNIGGESTASSQVSATPVLNNVISIAGGDSHSVLLKSDGTVWAWGYNSFGQLGDGTTTGRSTPVQVSGLTGITAIAGREIHTIALKNDGTVWAWGSNSNGQLGDGTTTYRYTPVQVSGLTGITAIAGGKYHTIALKNDGTVWAWGDNWYGQLGDGTTINRYTPVQVSGLTGITAIAGGGLRSIALKNDGTVWSWGYNLYGQLGDGTATNRSTPVQVSGLTGITAVVGGSDHTVALKNDGTVWSWGYNLYGQLGDGTTTGRSTPVQVSGLTGTTAIAGGAFHTIALKNDGTVYAWGWNYSGQLGDGTITNRATPVQVSGLTGITAIAGGALHTIALKNDGTVWAWGYNGYGWLGDGTTTDRYTPVQVSGITASSILAPASVSTSAATNSNTISWTAATGATSYNLYWSTSPQFTILNGTKISGATSPYTHTGLATGTTYYYIVTAVNAGGESTGSVQVSAKPQ